MADGTADGTSDEAGVGDLARRLERLVDPVFYRARYGAALEEGAEPARDFASGGYREGRAPSARHDHPSWLRLARSLDPEDLPDAVARWPGSFNLSELLESGLFDAGFYGARSGMAGEEGRLLLHYLTTGWDRGIDPSERFSTSWYLDTNPDVRVARRQPLLHYLSSGRREGRTPLPDPERAADLAYLREVTGEGWQVAARILSRFDADHYRRANPDIAEAGIDPLRHFMERGWAERRDPAPDFSIRFYLGRNPEAAVHGGNPLVHFALHGQAAGLRTHPAAPTPGPAEMRAASVREALSLAEGFHGRIAGRFDDAFYRASNPDIDWERTEDALDHYLVHGWREGRDPAPDFSTGGYLAANPEIAASGANPFAHFVVFGEAEGREGRPGAGAGGGPAILDAGAMAAVPQALVDEIAPHVDARAYLEAHPEVARAGADPVRHYLALGWRQGFDPSPAFSTRFYLERYPDLAEAGIAPLLHYVRHGRREGREPRSYVEARLEAGYAPLVSAIVPNYNHARFIEQRLASIDAQTYPNIEIIVLDDRSTDDSREVIEAFARTMARPVRLDFNEENSGNVFAQWRRGLELAGGELIWICESDDFCEPDFLERMVPHFADMSVTLGFGRIQFARSDGSFMPGLDAYREGAEPGIWDAPLVRPAAAWFAGGFGVNNVMANVGGGLFRARPVPDEVWEEVRSFRICGDWFLYIHLAGAGQIAYEPSAVAYFRQHDANTSATNFDKEYYYRENMRVLAELARQWGIPRGTRARFLGKVRDQYEHLGLEERLGDFDEAFGTAGLMELGRERPHVQLMFLGFEPGGGELFPINLAGALAERGVRVSMLGLKMTDANADMVARLDPRVPVYNLMSVTRNGRAAYLEDAGISVLHSHIVSAEAFLTELDPAPLERPLVVTLHGSYVIVEDLPEARIRAICDNVDRWIYTADRNLEFFERRDMDVSGFVKMPNAMPPDPRPAPFGRADLGIGEADTVFTLVARGIRRKGWRAAVEAFRGLRERRGRRDAHLLMIGEGEAEREARALAEGLEGVHFLGYRSEVNGIFRMSDAMLLPTRFEGESYPLIVVQALQEGLPVVATDIGEIGAMVTDEDGGRAGILLPNLRDSAAYFAALEAAMEEMTDPGRRAVARAVAGRLAARYDLDRLAGDYAAIYEGLAGRP